MTAADGPRHLRWITLHFLRVLLFIVLIALIHIQHARMRAQRRSQSFAPVNLDTLRKLFPEAKSLADETHVVGRRDVLDSSGKSLGYILQTSPGSDHLIGFSGPTNTLVAFGRDDRIIGIDVLSSGDTRDHVAQVIQDESFMKSFNGLSWQEAATPTDVDAVSGATLTSIAIQEAIIHRLSGGRSSLRFPEPLTVDDARLVFVSAHRVEQEEVLLSLWYVNDEQGEEIGAILRTSPFADHLIGYQGPTETRICFDVGGRIVGLSIGRSFDNEEYVTYVREDEYFLALFNGASLDELASLDLEEAMVDGVSGATMTSMAVADGLIAAAEQHRLALDESRQPRQPILNWTPRDFGTAGVILAGLILALTSLRGKKRLRLCFQVVLIVYLGLINGDMLSQAMIVGWAQNGVPWASAGGLVLLSAAAFLVPITTRRNAYCTHMCPHGAAQHVLRNRVPLRFRLPRWLMRTSKMIPALLLVWSIIVGMAMLPFSLVDIEPFDAWVFRVAGWATITIAVIGLAASLFVPMAYCRYGCPTGAMLSFLKFNSLSDHWSRRDWFAVAMVVIAFSFLIAS